MRIKNLTPHVVHYICDNSIYSIPPETVPARASVTSERADNIIGAMSGDGGFPDLRTDYRSFGVPTGLPEYVDGGDTMYIVSLILVDAARAAGRSVDDLLTPGEMVREPAEISIPDPYGSPTDRIMVANPKAGMIVGCTTFTRHR